MTDAIDNVDAMALVGALGVSGGSAEQDARAAEAGARAFAGR